MKAFSTALALVAVSGTAMVPQIVKPDLTTVREMPPRHTGEPMIRLQNANTIPLADVRLISGTRQISYGDLQPGQFSNYRPIANARTYSVIQATANGRHLTFQPDERMGPLRLARSYFTYKLTAEPVVGVLSVKLEHNEEDERLSRMRDQSAIAPPRSGSFVCRAFVRPSARAQPKPLSVIRMSEPGDRSVSSAAFRFRVTYSNDGYESPALNTYVYSESTKKLIEHSLFQFDARQRPLNQFIGEHGFTGLRYVNAPDSTAELQYFCRHDSPPSGGRPR